MNIDRILKLADEAKKHLEVLHSLLLDISRQCEESMKQKELESFKQAA